MAAQFTCKENFQRRSSGIQEIQSTSERRLAQNAYNILKQKGPEILVERLIRKRIGLISYRVIQSDEAGSLVQLLLATPRDHQL